ncbi:MAG: ATP synthase F1 subunit delta [Actinomycetota bacterium]
MNKDPKTIGYAKALFEIAKAEGDITRVADELFRIARTLETEHELRQTLTDIAVPLTGKEKLLSDLLGSRVSPHTLNILKFIIGQGRSRDLVEISDELARIAEEESNKEIGVVRSAVPLDAEQARRLEQALGAAIGKQVTVKVVVDATIVGGVVAQVGDVVIDGSVAHKFELLKQHLGAH